MKNRVTTVIVLLSMLASLAACGNSADKGQDTSAQSADDTSAAETAAPRDTPDFDSCDYDGEAFTILAFDYAYYDKYFFAEESNGDVMNDAIFDRKLMTESFLGVEIGKYIVSTGDELAATLKKTVTAGDDSFQMALPHCISGISSMAAVGCLYDWNSLPYIDFTKDYYNHNFNDALSLGDKQYYAVSDYMIANPSCILFNKDMITDYSLENPYQLVYDDTWTFDKMYEMAEKVTVDLNGDSVMDINDQYGITAEGDWILSCIPYACELFLVDKTADGSQAEIDAFLKSLSD